MVGVTQSEFEPEHHERYDPSLTHGIGKIKMSVQSRRVGADRRRNQAA
jgi:hypothetical protein